MATISFEGYTLGGINGQDGWSATGATSVCAIVSSPVYAGTRGYKHTGGSWDTAWKEMTPGSSGSGSFRIRWESGHVDPWRGGSFVIGKPSVGGVGWQFGMYSSTGTQVAIGGATNEVIGTYSLNTWYLIEFEWDSTPRCRARFNGGAWSNWISPSAGTYTEIGRISTSTLSTTFEIDDIVFNSGAPDVTVTPAVLGATFSLPSRTVTADLQFWTQTATFSIPAYTITAQRNLSTSVGILSARFTTPQEFISGGFWNDKYQGVTKTWFDKF